MSELVRAVAIVLASGALLAPLSAQAEQKSAPKNCPLGHDRLVQALRESVKPSGGPGNGGLDNNEWAAVVNREGEVCAIAYSGKKPSDQWPGSRAIAVEKADTANDVSLDNYAISTANLWGQAQPGASLYGLTTVSPPSGTEIAAGDPSTYGSATDPLTGKRAGGIVVFGGGLALYDGKHIVGALGVSGDTSCADHNVAWRVRQKLGLDKVPNGPSPAHNDEIVYDVGANGKSVSGWGHPECGLKAPQVAMQIGAGAAVTATASQPASGSGSSAPPAGNGPSTLPGFQR
jgi:uncharacterized protein GlcG (DUF336 family)